MIEVEQCSKCGKLKIPKEIKERVENGESIKVEVDWNKIETYASNTLLWEVGGLNIDACRIGTDEIKTHGIRDGTGNSLELSNYESPEDYEGGTHKGRWPPNVILDPISSQLLDGQSGESKSTGGRIESKTGYGSFGNGEKKVIDGEPGFGDEGGASRFFYSSKAHKSERHKGLKSNQKNKIATLKPINLMRWLCRLVTPKDGIVLDPFAGSGTTGCACEIEGFKFVGIEKRKRFAKVIAPKRIEYWSKPKNWEDLKEHEELPNPEENKWKGLSDF